MVASTITQSSMGQKSPSLCGVLGLRSQKALVQELAEVGSAMGAPPGWRQSTAAEGVRSPRPCCQLGSPLLSAAPAFLLPWVSSNQPVKPFSCCKVSPPSAARSRRELSPWRGFLDHLRPHPHNLPSLRPWRPFRLQKPFLQAVQHNPLQSPATLQPEDSPRSLRGPRNHKPRYQPGFSACHFRSSASPRGTGCHRGILSFVFGPCAVLSLCDKMKDSVQCRGVWKIKLEISAGTGSREASFRRPLVCNPLSDTFY